MSEERSSEIPPDHYRTFLSHMGRENSNFFLKKKRDWFYGNSATPDKGGRGGEILTVVRRMSDRKEGDSGVKGKGGFSSSSSPFREKKANSKISIFLLLSLTALRKERRERRRAMVINGDLFSHTHKRKIKKIVNYTFFSEKSWIIISIVAFAQFHY